MKPLASRYKNQLFDSCRDVAGKRTFELVLATIQAIILSDFATFVRLNKLYNMYNKKFSVLIVICVFFYNVSYAIIFLEYLC